MVLQRLRSADGGVELLNERSEIRNRFWARDHQNTVGPGIGDDLSLTTQQAGVRARPGCRSRLGGDRRPGTGERLDPRPFALSSGNPLSC